jgi:hypothetical protein
MPVTRYIHQLTDEYTGLCSSDENVFLSYDTEEYITIIFLGTEKLKKTDEHMLFSVVAVILFALAKAKAINHEADRTGSDDSFFCPKELNGWDMLASLSREIIAWSSYSLFVDSCMHHISPVMHAQIVVRTCTLVLQRQKER